MAPGVGFMPLRETPGSLLSLFLSLSPSGKQKKMYCESVAAGAAKRTQKESYLAGTLLLDFPASGSVK